MTTRANLLSNPAYQRELTKATMTTVTASSKYGVMCTIAYRGHKHKNEFGFGVYEKHIIILINTTPTLGLQLAWYMIFYFKDTSSCAPFSPCSTRGSTPSPR